jgi:cytoskeletal protein CcmA (bactofilin family)
MAFFPVSPSDGQQANVGNITYRWSAATGAWDRVGTTITTILDGTIVTFSGNLNVTGTGVSAFQGALTAGSTVSAPGNVTGGNLVTAGTVTALGNISGTNFVTTGAISATGAITAGSATINGALQAASANIPGGVTAASNIVGTNIIGLTSLRAPLISATGNIVIDGDIIGGGSVTVPGTVVAGNLTATNASLSGNVTAGSLALSGNINLSGEISAVGNISTGPGSYFIGNGALLTGISTGGVSLGTRSNASINTGTIANAVTSNTAVVGYAGYALYKITTNVASWVRIYSSEAARTADSGRSQFNDPQPGAGVIAEAITLGANVVLVTPGAIGFVDSNPVSNNIPIAVTNLSGSPADVNVTLTLLQIEVDP